MKPHILFILLFLSVTTLGAIQQDTTHRGIGWIENGDTIIERRLKEIWVYPGLNSMSQRQQRRFWRYVYKIKKVYPYAQRANELLKEYEPEYSKLESRREQRAMMKEIEKQLLDEYKDDLKKFTLSEGKLLIKLIDRETGRTSYSLIQDFRGNFSAFFWQTIARLFQNDLKSEYDPEGEDRIIEEVIRLIETGQF